jgi:hypothetical protein
MAHQEIEKYTRAVHLLAAEVAKGEAQAQEMNERLHHVSCEEVRSRRIPYKIGR